MAKKNKIEQLKEWMQRKKVFATHEVQEWGFRHYYISADRRKRELAENSGPVRKLSEDEKKVYGYNCKDDVYIWRGAEKETVSIATGEDGQSFFC